MNNLTIRDFWPEDPRYGTAAVKPPLYGDFNPEYVEGIDALVEGIQIVVQQFEQWYPDNFWWTQEFVENNPEVALLMQALHQQLIFSSHADLMCLYERVLASSELSVDSSLSREIQVARLAFEAILKKSDEGHAFNLAREIMTDGDKLELGLLLRGISRVVVNPLE